MEQDNKAIAELDGQEAASPVNPIGEVVAGAIILAVALFGIHQSVELGISASGTTGPGFFPLLLCIGIAIADVFYLIDGVQRMRQQAPEANAVEADDEQPSQWRVVKYALSLVVFALAMPYLGYLATAFIVCFSQLRFVERVSWLVSLALAAFLAVASFALFKSALGVPLPPPAIW